MSMKREPLLSAYDIEKMARQEGSNWRKEHQQDAVNGAEDVIEKVRDIYESARAKDAELIQRLVNDLARAYCIDRPSLAEAQAAGFTPTNS